MGLQIFSELPKPNGDLVAVHNLPITVEPSEGFHQAKAVLLALVAQAGSLTNTIQTDAEYEQGIGTLQAIKRFKKEIAAGIDPAKKQLNSAKDQLMGFIHELDVPAGQLETALSKETARYAEEKERQRREEEERQRREAERERQRLQRDADLNALRAEIDSAKQTADAADAHGEPETAKEILACLKRFSALDSAPGAYQKPLEDATQVKQAVALALQREQARIAAAKAKAEGDKVAAKQIEKAAAKLEAPDVAPVVSERIEAAPVVVPKEELAKAKGQFVKEVWKVQEVSNPGAARRWLAENSAGPLCDHEISRLNEYAKRMGAQAQVPGVTFYRDVKTAGIRS